MLAVGTFGMTFISSFFLRVIPHHPVYAAVSSDEFNGDTHSNQLHRSKSADSKRGAAHKSLEPGMHPAALNGSYSLSRNDNKDSENHLRVHDVPNADPDETSSLMSKSSVSVAGDVEENGQRRDSTAHDPHHLDIRGMALLPKIEFWQLFILLGLLTGIGLMTIKYVPSFTMQIQHLLSGNIATLATTYVLLYSSAIYLLIRRRHKLYGVTMMTASLQDGFKDVS